MALSGAAAEAQVPGGPPALPREMWNPLHESDRPSVAWRRARWLCAGALLAAGLFLFGFLLGRDARAQHAPAPARQSHAVLEAPAVCGVGSGDCGLVWGQVGMSLRELGGGCWGAVGFWTSYCKTVTQSKE